MIFKDDLIKEIVNKKPQFTEEQVEEVFDSCLKNLKDLMRAPTNYAIKIPFIGYMYKDYVSDKLMSVHPHILSTKEESFINSCYNRHRRRLIGFSKGLKQEMYKDKTDLGIMEFQNNV